MKTGLSRYQQSKLDAAFARADRDAALRKQDGKCKYCCVRLNYRNATRDHVVPRSKGGLDERNNIVAACLRCNKLKGSMPVKQFTRLIHFPQPGDPIIYRMIWFDWRLNVALDRMEDNVMKAVGRRRG